MSELEEDIEHCEEVLADWHGCDECKADHERLLSYMKELLEYRKSIMSDKKYEGMKAITDWIKNCPSEEFMKTFNELGNNYSGLTIGDFLGADETEELCYDIKQDFKEIIEELKQLDINISNLIQIYDCHQIEGNDYEHVYNTRDLIKKCIRNIESLSFLRVKND